MTMRSRIKISLVTLLAAIGAMTFAPKARGQELPELLLGTQTNSVSRFPLYVAMKKGLFRGTASSSSLSSYRDEVLPLLQDFIELENAEMTRRAYEAIKDIWPENGLSSDEGLKNVMAAEDVPRPAQNNSQHSF